LAQLGGASKMNGELGAAGLEPIEITTGGQFGFYVFQFLRRLLRGNDVVGWQRM
jgi:hypothetical protein